MKQQWVKLWERKYSLHKMELATAVLRGDYMKSFTGLKIAETMGMLMPNKNHGFYISEQNLDELFSFISSIVNNSKQHTRYMKEYAHAKKNLLSASRKAAQQSQKKHTQESLAKVFQDFAVADDRFMLVGQWLGFYLAEYMAAEAGEYAAKMITDNKEQKQFLEVQLLPNNASGIRRERKHLLSIALEKNKKTKQKMIEQHVKKFAWIPCLNYFDKPWTKDFFKKELGKTSIQSARKELKEIESHTRSMNKLVRDVSKRLSNHDKKFMERARASVTIKDDRDDTRREAYYYSTNLCRAIAKKLNISDSEFLLHTYSEIILALQKDKHLSKKELVSRARGYVVVWEHGKRVIKTGSEYKKILRETVGPKKSSKQIGGIIASSGHVIGKVKIVISGADLDKIKQGDILVAVTTHPEYLPAMRKAAAFVTDEGGITSHAAIVSREMKKPCVVGTKHATEVFKDGDKVEIDAIKGIVRKI
jgi:phosphoenolpyruvate synthase/pyruvate phosphate dikinase